jgi:hypothetical protein
MLIRKHRKKLGQSRFLRTLQSDNMKESNEVDAAETSNKSSPIEKTEASKKNEEKPNSSRGCARCGRFGHKSEECFKPITCSRWEGRACA